MALAQRSGARFFAAFYRWELHTRYSPWYASKRTYYRHGVSTLQHYHSIRLIHQPNQADAQVQEDSTANVDNDIEESTSEAVRAPVFLADGKQEDIASRQLGVEVQGDIPEPSNAELKAINLKNSVRQLMRNVPSSVAVITVVHIDPDTGKNVPMGVAISSLSTVTLDPPTISFNIKEPSKTLDAIRTAHGLFRVHFPAADRGGANLVDLFCRGNHAEAYSMRAKLLKLYHPKDKKHPSTTRSCAPQILNDFVLAAMECEVIHEFPVADHVILVAKIDDLEQKALREPTILYLDRGYRNPQGEIIQSSRVSKTPTVGQGVWSVWEYPLFPDEKQRREYLRQIKMMIMEDPKYYKELTRDTYRSIDASLPYPAANFGINLELLIAECRKEMGLANHFKPELETQQVLDEFYGVLTPSMRQRIVNRAKKLVALDSRFLSQNYRLFLHSLSVSPHSRDLLPSDIMGPLRAAKLAPPFEPRKEHDDRTTGDIRKIEQIEHLLRERYRKMIYPAALKEPFEDAMEAIGENKQAARFFKKSRARLLTQSHPSLFDASVIDISGHVTPQELRVVLCRVIDRLHISSQIEFRKNIGTDWYEILRRVGVNPTITGMDVEFLIGKIKYLFYSARHFREFPPAVENMMKPWISWNVDWDDLEERVKLFVQKTPLRAIAWSRTDRLAAMGLHWNATVRLRKQKATDEAVNQPLGDGHIIDTLVAKELKRHYGNGTKEENEGIAKYLQAAYNFDVTNQSMQYSPKASTSETSDVGMQQDTKSEITFPQQYLWIEPPKKLDRSESDSKSGLRQGSSPDSKIRLITHTPSKEASKAIKSPKEQESQLEWRTYSFRLKKEES